MRIDSFVLVQWWNSHELLMWWIDRRFAHQSGARSDVPAHNPTTSAQSHCWRPVPHQSSLEWRDPVPGSQTDRTGPAAAHHLQRIPSGHSGTTDNGCVRIDDADDRLHVDVRRERQSVHHQRVLGRRFSNGSFAHPGKHQVNSLCF